MLQTTKTSSPMYLHMAEPSYKTKEYSNHTAVGINNMTVSYQGKPALSDISLSIDKGKITGIVGPNGAGKSSLIKGVLGLVDTSPETQITINGKDIESQRSKIAYVEQRNSIDLSFPINVEETVLLGTYPNLGLFRRPGTKEKELASKALATVQMEAFAKRQISQLSGGQLQRVFIARALAQQAEIFLLDEPFVGIDAVSEELIVELLKTLKNQGKTIAIVHHDLHKVTQYFDDIILLDRKLIAYGAVKTTFTTSNIQKAYGESMGNVVVKGA